MRKSLLGSALIAAAVSVASYSILAPGLPQVARNLIGFAAAVAGVAGAFTLISIMYGSGGEYADEYVMLNGSLVCRSESLSRHKCMLKGLGINDLKRVMRGLLNELITKHNYRLRDSTELMAVLSRGSGGKPAMVVIHVDERLGRLEMTYVIDPLRASGIADLKWIAEEVGEAVSGLKVLKDSNC